MSKQDQFGLIGYPLQHSFSQRFFTEKFKREGIDAKYSNFEIADISIFSDIVNTNSSLKGINVTLPYKEVVIPYLTQMDADARAMGAVNVIKLWRENGVLQLKGYNSDVVGFKKSIEPLVNKEYHKKALVLGTGGASKAVVHGLSSLGIESILVSRNRGDNMLTYEDLSPAVMTEYKVVINCSPVGTFPNVDEAPNIPYDLLTIEHLLYDLVYNPAETEFLKRGAQRGATIKNGAEMLELQALEAWRIWNEE